MSLFDWLFGQKKKQVLEDGELGIFTLVGNKDKIIWAGSGKFLHTDVEVFIPGTETQLDDSGRNNVLKLYRNAGNLEPEINKILKQEFEHADKEFINWSDHFSCISISVVDETVISFEEKDSLYHFNVFIENSKATGVSIDS